MEEDEEESRDWGENACVGLVEDIPVFIFFGQTQVDTNGAHPSGTSGLASGRASGKCPAH
jgi:hypothetical protein